VNGFSLLVLIAIALGVVIAYRAGLLRRPRGEREAGTDTGPSASGGDAAVAVHVQEPPPSATNDADQSAADIGAEKSRIIVSLEAEAAQLRRRMAGLAAEGARAAEFDEDRRHVLRELADARGETARYRQLLIDLENNAPPPLLDSPGAPDDLRLIVGVGPVLERMLQQLGISTYRQIARWSERDIDEFDARLHEFPGRIRRDAWVTQARALHQSKFGEPLPPREHT
jgi:predicted flap endonuclease-1-like 5' DNA nuclease